MSDSLPKLREELDLFPGPRLSDGQPSWTLHDPVRNLFFQLDWSSFEILSRWALGDAARIVSSIRAETTLHIDTPDVEAFAAFLQKNQLSQPVLGAAANLAELLRKQRGSAGQWLLHHYLFLRIPLVRPDAWLSRWAPRLDALFSRNFLLLTLLAALFGLISVYREWPRFSATLVDLLSWQGLLAYGLTLVGVKVLHELGHAFTAKRFGCHVPTMGVALLVLWPVAYTDTNDVWKLTRREQRLQVAAAGIATELSVAAWATLAWVWLPEGWPKTVAFLLSSTTWISTLLINASPFMRFDGYFLLSDALQLPNLHERSFALARWDLRERLFALGAPVPEHFPRARHNGLILFAYAVWLYRLLLFLGIAFLVYQFFIKVVGILLLAAELCWFIFLPVFNELKVWHANWTTIRDSRRGRRSLLLFALLIGLFVLPWPTRVSTSALLLPHESLEIYAPPHARITTLPHANGSRIHAGDLLLGMESPDLQVRTAQAGARSERLAWQSASAGFDPEQRKQWQVLNEQLGIARAENLTVSADAARYSPTAPYAGILRDLDPDLRVGDWVSQGEILARLVRQGPQQVITYIDDEAVQRIAPGDRALFVNDGADGPILRLEVVSIDRDASRTLNEPELATEFGGHLLVREKNGILYPERAVYRVLLKVTDDRRAPQYAWRGQVSIAANWEAPGLRFLRSATNVLLRELGF
ncbi:HlyD family efflux transporter periplasmic adaptor subunit [Pseudomonas benzenivorans]|uniref:HlyD family efflux transporter periplasmic adaptor subunit n=1 Tax=Pseudomonas benzenivorans TaxID=556533 RepID=A0ABY5H4M7_9PSED|nr:HlyD family efflux transporter periplasmic adaptor subunit [Pseudomonas benzenivorans]UTW06974.1 HlyD family efflux transporter periplasmic adaptor subunit [Pseudomonas benzenivorans]